MDIQSAIQSVIDKKHLNNDEMRSVMQNIMTGECTDAQIAGFLFAFYAKQLAKTANENKDDSLLIQISFLYRRRI